MQTPQKKVFKAFRIAPELEAELRRRSELTNINQTAIVEEALRTHFAKTMVEQLTKAVKKMVRGARIERATPTVSRLMECFS